MNRLVISVLKLNLTALRITSCGISKVEVDSFHDLILLTEISLSRNRLQTIPTQLFVNNPKLTTIDLSYNILETLDISVFKDLQNLAILDLSGNRLSQFPANLPFGLNHLNLENNKISKIPASNRLSRLGYLNLCQNEKNINLDLNAIGCLKLNSLCLDDAVIRQVHRGNFSLQFVIKNMSNYCFILLMESELGKLNDLQELTIQGQKSRNERLAMEPLNSIKVCTKLQKLKIERCDLASLSILAQFNDLKTLELKEVFVEQQPSASEFEGCSNLEALDLTGSQKLAQSILGKDDIITKFQKVKTLILKDCKIGNLNWIPNKNAATVPVFPNLLTVDISGDNEFDCSDKKAKQALCRFDNLKRVEPTEPEWKIVNKPSLILENSNSTNCRQQGLLMSTNSVMQLNFESCDENEKHPMQAPPQEPDDQDNFSSSTTFSAVTDATFEDKADEPQSNDDVFVTVGVFLAVLVVGTLTLLAFIYYHRRKHENLNTSASTEQGITNPQYNQTKV